MMKKYLTLPLFFISFCAFSQTGSLKVVLSNYLNQNYGDKPYVGSKVFIIKEDAEIKDIYENLASIETKIGELEKERLKYIDDEIKFNRKIDSLNRLIKDTSTMPTKTLRNQKKLVIIEKKTLNNRDQIIELDKSIQKIKNSLLKTKKNSSTSIIQKSKLSEFVDGNGTFSVDDLEYGKYYLYITSNQRIEKNIMLKVTLNQKYQTIYHKFYLDNF